MKKRSQTTVQKKKKKITVEMEAGYQTGKFGDGEEAKQEPMGEKEI